MKFSFRKISTVLASALMLTSTVALGLAANYPAPFVANGTADVAIVYGSNAAMSQTDLVAATDVTANLKAALASQTASSGTSTGGATVSGGDFVKLEKSTDKVNLGDSLNSVFGATVDDEDLEVLLADGTYLNDENTEYDYEQRLTIPSAPALNLTFFADSDYKSKEPTVGFRITSNTPILNYSLDFTTDAQSDVSATSELSDIETTDLKILGKSYYVLDADYSTTSAKYHGTFTLLDSANTAIVEEGDTQTVIVADKSYDVSINFIGSSTVKLDVNGEVTNTLSQGGTYKLTDGTYVGVKDILVQDYAGGVKKVEFSLGTGKLEITAGSEIEMNDDTVDGVRGWVLKGSNTSTKDAIDKVVIEWVADDEVFITPGQELVMPGFGAVKFSMGNFVVPSEEVVAVDYDGDDSIEISVPVKDGLANFNILQSNSTGEFKVLGKDADERLATVAPGTTSLMFYEKNNSDNYHRWFVATYATTDTAESYLLSATVDEKEAKNRTTIKNEVTGENVCTDKVAGDTCDIGDVTLTVGGVSKTSTRENVTFTAGTGVNFNTIYTKEGLKIFLPFEAGNTGAANTQAGSISIADDTNNSAGHTSASFYLVMSEENKDDDKGVGQNLTITLDDNTDGDVHITAVTANGENHEIVGTDDDTVARMHSDLGTQVKKLVASDKGKAEVTYSGSQAYAEVFITDTSASVSGNGGAELGTVPIADTEVASVSGKNLIVVGGSCVNSVAASLLGGALCGADFEAKTGVGAGSYLIETFSRSGGKVATLVAGYNAGDTSNAAKALTTQTIDTTAGKAYTGTTATSVEPVVA